MDSAVWAVWYDLPEGNNDEYMSWMHGEYLPSLKQRPGVAWVAHYENVTNERLLKTVHSFVKRAKEGEAGTGRAYIQLVGVSDAYTLFAPSFIAQERRETGRNRQMLDRRMGVQSYALAEVFRVNGPELHLRPPGTTPAAAIQMGMLRLDHHDRKHGLNDWYVNNRLPLIARMPDTIGARVFTCLAGWPDLAVLYEFASVEGRERSFEPQESDIDAHRRVKEEDHPIPVDALVHAPGSPQAARRIYP